MRKILNLNLLLLSLLLSCEGPAASLPSAEETRPVLETYARILHGMYEDSLLRGQALGRAIEAFLSGPSEEALMQARSAWTASRRPYMQSEFARFYGGPIDDPENDIDARLNSWPLDEAFIDYVLGPPPDFQEIMSGLINEPERLPQITKEALLRLNGAGGEENVTLGYHAIEFLLWGQDFDDNGPGRRPASDYIDGRRANADRRRQFLRATTELLLEDLSVLEDAWREGSADNYRARFISLGPKEGLTRVFTGLVNMAGFELAHERLLVPYRTAEQEDEHSCFSDTTLEDHIDNQKGIEAIYIGRYERIDGRLIEGPSISELVRARDPGLDREIRQAMREAMEAIRAIPAPFDRAIREEPGRPKVKAASEAVAKEAELLKRAAERLGISVTLLGGE
ncbi:MAG: iron-regulated protein [Sandaracinaceae bacterium]|nr:iron-regulated protein [Sandaracinaceae bacterium]